MESRKGVWPLLRDPYGNNTPHKEVLSIRQVMEISPLPAVTAIVLSANRWPS